MALQAIRALGYPRNAAILPLVVDHLVDGNWPGWSDAIGILMDVTLSLVTPLLREILLDQGKKRELWYSDVEGICAALSHMGKEYILPCIPSILFVLSLRVGLDDPDPEFLLRALEHAEIYHYSYLLPTLLRISDTATQEATRRYAESLVRQFSSKDLEPYKRVLSSPSS